MAVAAMEVAKAVLRAVSMAVEAAEAAKRVVALEAMVAELERIHWRLVHHRTTRPMRASLWPVRTQQRQGTARLNEWPLCAQWAPVRRSHPRRHCHRPPRRASMSWIACAHGSLLRAPRRGRLPLWTGINASCTSKLIWVAPSRALPKTTSSRSAISHPPAQHSTGRSRSCRSNDPTHPSCAPQSSSNRRGPRAANRP